MTVLNVADTITQPQLRYQRSHLTVILHNIKDHNPTTAFFFRLKTRYLAKDHSLEASDSTIHLRGHLKSKQSFTWTSPPKLVDGVIDPETLIEAHFMILSEHYQTNPRWFNIIKLIHIKTIIKL